MANDDNEGSKRGTALHDSVSLLRDSIRPSYPEIDRLHSDAYLAAVLSVPDRTYEYARDEKIQGALQWRREYGVDALVAAFDYDDGGEDGGVFRLADRGDVSVKPDTVTGSPAFRPSQSLIEICLSGAFSLAGFNSEGRIVLLARTTLLDWWRTGVDDGIRYHVLVIERALKIICEHNKNKSRESDATTPESIVLHVDTTDSGLMPPPLGALTGMAKLLQRAYPDRIHKIYIGPVNGVLMKLYELISPFLRPRSRDKITLMECAPSGETAGLGGGGRASDESAVIDGAAKDL